MADEWKVIELYGPNADGAKRRVGIADGASVSIGAALELIDPRTASSSHLGSVPLAGVAAEEHVADKGVTEIAVWTDLLVDARSSGAGVIGRSVVLDAVTNHVKEWTLVNTASSALTVAASYANILGKYQETASDNEVVNIRVGPL